MKAAASAPETVAPTAARPRAEHLGPERRRPLILDAAFAVFLDRGYDGASMDAIAQEAGVTKPVVYSCFASKEELFAALLAREEERILDQIASAIPARADADPEQTLADALTAFLRAVADSPDAYRVIFLGSGGANGAIAERVERGRRAQVDAVAALAEAWLAMRGVEDPANPARLLAHALVGAAEAAARALLAEPELWEPETMGPMLARMIVRGERAIADLTANEGDAA